MIKSSSTTPLNILRKFIENFERNKFEDKDKNKSCGSFYTPDQLSDFIVHNIIKIYLEEQCEAHNLFKNGMDFGVLEKFLNANYNLKNNIEQKLLNIKILDPSCGSGRFLISSANLLLKLYKLLDEKSVENDVKKSIIEKNLYGMEIDKNSCLISKLRLIIWLYSDDPKNLEKYVCNVEKFSFQDIELILNNIKIKINVHNLDFLLPFNSNAQYDVIVGNPPYVENKKIRNQEYKLQLYKNFVSACKLFDLSILFIEKSMQFLKENCGYLSFLITNKFLSADYGVKIRNLLIKNADLKEILNISSLPVFGKTAIYPIIISLKKNVLSSNNSLNIKKFNSLKELYSNNYATSINLHQALIQCLPAKVIPITGNVPLISSLFLHFKSMEESIKDLKIIYRPFGFINWVRNFEYISNKRSSDNDLILLGTGNVEKYYFNFDKRIKIAKQDLEVSYFNYNEQFIDIWNELSNEKLIFREIAKDLTCAYDPGIFANITGLYFIRIPSFDTNRLFCLLTVLNSSLMDVIFKTLFGTLHMSGNFLRFNGSFVKRLPMPDDFPVSLAHLGKLIQFLSQLRFDLNSLKSRSFNSSELERFNEKNHDKIDTFLNFFKIINNSLINLLYFTKIFPKLNSNYILLTDILQSNDFFQDIQFKYILPRFSLSSFICFQISELTSNFNKIEKLFTELVNNSDLVKEIENASQIIYSSISLD